MAAAVCGWCGCLGPVVQDLHAGLGTQVAGVSAHGGQAWLQSLTAVTHAHSVQYGVGCRPWLWASL